jgi:predicted Zn-dependent protease
MFLSGFDSSVWPKYGTNQSAIHITSVSCISWLHIYAWRWSSLAGYMTGNYALPVSTLVREKSETMEHLNPSEMFDLMTVQEMLDSDRISSAREHMQKISPEKRDHPSVLYISYQIHAKAGEWGEAIQIADSLLTKIPDSPSARVILAETVCYKPGGSFLEGKEVLLRAESDFPDNFLIVFKLASYCVQLLEIDEAHKWIKHAIAIDGERVALLAAKDKNILRLSGLAAGGRKAPRFAS